MSLFLDREEVEALTGYKRRMKLTIEERMRRTAGALEKNHHPSDHGYVDPDFPGSHVALIERPKLRIAPLPPSSPKRAPERPEEPPEPIQRRFADFMESAIENVLAKRGTGWTTRAGYLAKEICRVALSNSERLLKAAALPPSVEQMLDEFEATRTKTRKKLAEELRPARARVRDLGQKIVAMEADLAELNREYRQRLQFMDRPEMYPEVPLPTTTTRDANEEIPEGPGVYFYWDRGRVEYVGQSIKLRLRLGIGHHVVKPGSQVSFLEFDRRILSWAEAYYIGILQPSLNFGQSGAHNKYREEA